MDAACYVRMARHQKEVAERETEGYGIAVAFYQTAARAAQHSLAVAAQARHRSFVTNSVERYHETIAQELQAAQEENRSIYYDPVPPPDDLPQVQAAPMAKVKPPPEIPVEGTEALLGTLVPAAVTDAVTRLDRDVQDEEQRLKAESEEAADMARARLGSMGLPG